MMRQSASAGMLEPTSMQACPRASKRSVTRVARSFSAARAMTIGPYLHSLHYSPGWDDAQPPAGGGFSIAAGEGSL